MVSFWEVDLRMVGVRIEIGLPLKNEDLGVEEREVVRDAVAMVAAAIGKKGILGSENCCICER
ncbi:hypothetical protein A2U01_0061964 [Trifolium medium]|uniref:Uncharacterized protein n=1 Tax=Trifolium medium TaxID=97028 RepID=A0A392RVR2_9FABA|nr:hypothetical protein [Trifolium medium]